MQRTSVTHCSSRVLLSGERSDALAPRGSTSVSHGSQGVHPQQLAAPLPQLARGRQDACGRSVEGPAIGRRIIEAEQLAPAIVPIAVIVGGAGNLLPHVDELRPERIHCLAVRALPFDHEAPGALALATVRPLEDGREQ